ncbi:MAG: AmmeMemoRadiSam system radical SAM enzyme [Candidatus Aenigmatarchaeota archaeon]
MKEAILYKIEKNRVICTACKRYCKLLPNQVGFCGVRINKDNKLYLANYGLFCAANLDPIEKKPFFHFYIGSVALSFGTFGCNWACKYCCNYDISQRRKIEGFEFLPNEIVNIAKKYKEIYNISSICFTYNEPTIYAEYIYDVSKIAKKESLKIIFITNGYLSDESIEFFSEFSDAITIDFKGNGNNEFARKFISIPSYEPVFQSLEELSKKKIHLEITDLIIPKVGDNLDDCKKLCKKIYDCLGEKSIIHFLRFSPTYKMLNFPSTPIEILEKHAEIAIREGIKYVYIGNVFNHKLENTYCPNCKNILIKRVGFLVQEINLNKKNRCKFCNYKIHIVGSAETSKLLFPKQIDEIENKKYKIVNFG